MFTWHTVRLLHFIVNDTTAHRVGQVSVRQQQLEGVWQVRGVPLDNGLHMHTACTVLWRPSTTPGRG